MKAAFVLYEGMTALDLIGPYQVLATHPDIRQHFVAEKAGPVRSDSGLTIVADTAFGDLPDPDLVVVPGGGGWREALEMTALTDWLAAVYPGVQRMTSVCSGSTLLAKAGLLDGRPATTHWAIRPVLEKLGAVVSEERVVIDGNVITGAGVSAGIDMGLTLAAQLWGERFAQRAQLGLEYDPQPPFDAGSPDKAPQDIVDELRAMIG
ncbi:DJ-1/PfpI family protein [Pseudonocardiaceae bacterium YIM PH 21723]|nr:DJ-1/PfpI family protein [Pseudonocardiaceae bacterium YIM PH 21723]